MRIVSLTVSGYRQFLSETSLLIPHGVTGMCGPNGVGKSKLIEAIGYALYGPHRKILPKGDKVVDLASRFSPDAKPRVELVLELRGQNYRILRTSGETGIYFENELKPLAETPRGVTKKVIELLSLSPLAYDGTFVARQNEVAGLQTLGSLDRQRLVNRLIGIALVEKGIELAKKEYSNRERNRSVEEGKVQLTPAKALEQLEKLQATHTASREEETALEARLESLRLIYNQAQAAVGAHNEQKNHLVALEKECESKTAHKITLMENLNRATERVEKVVKAELEFSLLESVLTETTDTQAQLEWYENLAKFSELQERKRNLELELSDKILPQVEFRNSQLAAHDNVEAEIQELSAKTAELNRNYSLAEQRMQQASEEAKLHDNKRQNAIKLGKTAPCNTCGQIFGDNLENALTHFFDEAELARKRKTEESKVAQTLKIQKESSSRLLDLAKSRKNKIGNDLKTNDLVPGEYRQQLRRIKELEDDLKNYPAYFSHEIYDSQRYNELVQTIDTRNEALTRKNELSLLLNTAQEARQEERTVAQELDQLVTQISILGDEISHLSLTLNSVENVEEACSAAKLNLEEADQQVRAASRKTASLTTQVEQGKNSLDQAEKQAQKVVKVQRDAMIAERTEKILEQLLKEITAEARPRLAELMDSWARALLGPRFRGVDLTEDYRIRADNGSGWHHIEHFSGGEQTLLAIMLRVAISLFCRERAGFDTGFLILDEIFGDQDGEHRAQLVQFLGEIQVHYHQILVVNHVEDVTNLLDNVIDVFRKEDNSSKACIRV